MNIKCSELDNISVSFDYFNSIKAVGDEVVKYVRGFNQLSQEYIKKLQLFQTNFAKKLAKSDNPKITQITSLTSKITEIVSQIEELCQVSINDIDSRVKSFETLLKEKLDNVNSLKKSPAELILSLNPIIIPLASWFAKYAIIS